MTWVELFFGFRGRIGRQTFWLASLLPTALYIPSMLEAYQRLKLAMVIATSKAPQFADLMTHRNAGGTSFSAILALIALYIMITLNAKRLHDLGKSGWMQGIAVVGFPMAIGGFGMMFIPSMATLGWLLCLGSLVFSLWGFWIVIQIWFFAGQPGSNPFGPSPLGDAMTTGVAHEIEALHAAAARSSVHETAVSATDAPRRSAKQVRTSSIQPAGFGRRGPRMA